ncbi:MAG: hypothetical protein H8K06_18965 [Nitrospira sp.]|uniref:Glycosyltransferase RgtA/B/C/D-like domain-containing protein n=1 Tax=Nitrospira defluvii TaxID=330214 RepID=A0ABN7MBI0_9BACT|nr:hypothetical protein [Nitrospira defluvii]MCS6329144.1 hypothetical protein [Nitrospira sp.]CAE6789271.1 conserved membrane hypothetical protein [Nitrospira defluvii]
MLLIALIPLVLVHIPPLVDYPNHLARVHILADNGQHPLLRQYYEIHWDLLPNLAIDILLPPLLTVVSVETAGKLFLGLILTFLAFGTIALHRALHQRWSPWPILAFFFLYNSVFLWGFLNYLFGLGLALLSSALWITLRDRSARLLIPLFSLLAVVLFFAHLFAFGVFALVVLSYEGASWWSHRHAGGRFMETSLGKALPTTVLPMILLILSPTFRTNPADYPFWLRGLPPPPAVTFLPLNVKVEAFKGVLRTEHQGLDRVSAVLLVGLVGVGLWRRQWSLRPSMYLPLAATLGAALAMPASIGTTAVVDIRMPVVVVLLAIASSDWPNWRRRWFVPVALAFSLLFVMRMAVITEGWLETDRHYRQFIAALDQLPEGTRLLSAIKLASYDANSPRDSRIPETRPMVNLSCWGIIRRSAFVSNLFTAPGQQPVQLTPPMRSLLTVEEFLAQAVPIPWDRFRTQYDYVVVRRTQTLRPPVPSDFVPVTQGEEFTLYRIPERQP